MQFCILPDLVSSGKCLHISVSEAELDVVFIMPRSLKVQIIMYFQKNEQIEKYQHIYFLTNGITVTLLSISERPTDQR